MFRFVSVNKLPLILLALFCAVNVILPAVEGKTCSENQLECRIALSLNETSHDAESLCSNDQENERSSAFIPARIHVDYNDGPFRCYVATSRFPKRMCQCLKADCSSNASYTEREHCEICSRHGGVYSSYEDCMKEAEDVPGPRGILNYPEPKFADESLEGKVFGGERSGSAARVEPFVLVDVAAEALDQAESAGREDDCPHLQSGLSRWCDPGTWSSSNQDVISFGSWTGPEVPTDGVVILPVGKKVLLDQCGYTRNAYITQIVVPETSELIFPNEDMELKVTSILVRGALRIGSSRCRIGASIKITMPPNNLIDKLRYGIIADTGEVDIHGSSGFGAPWTRLEKTALPGDTSIKVQTRVDFWRPGQQILITTSQFKDEVFNQNEVVEIASVSGDTLYLKSPLQYNHYGGAEYQCEVALISRNIMVMGTEETLGNKVGPQIFLGGRSSRIEGLLVYRGGQRNVKGAYPFHFHMLGSSTQSSFVNNVVYQSYYRCFVVHGTSDARIVDNVAFDAHGHCFYLEDGVEEGNTFQGNLAAFIHSIGLPAGGVSQSGETFYQSTEVSQPADHGAAGFYVSNPNNNLIGNAASGGVSGYAFPVLPKPIGINRVKQITPAGRPFGAFRDNTAHSSGYFSLQTGGCIYFGGSLWEERLSDYQFRLVYNSGRSSFPNNNNETPVISSNKVWLCNQGLLFWGEKMNIDYWTSYDSIRSVFLLSKSIVSNAFASAESPNAITAGFPGNRNDFEPQTFIQLYDTGTMTIIQDLELENFKYMPELGFWRPSCFHSMTHSDQYKPAGMVQIGNCYYLKGVDYDAIVRLDKRETGSSRMFNFISIGGSAVEDTSSQIVGGWPAWWNLNNVPCSFQSSWNTWVCTKTTDTTIARLDVRVPGYTKERDQALPPTPENYIGYVSQFGDASKRMTVTINEGITGCTGKQIRGCMCQWHIVFYHLENVFCRHKWLVFKL